MTIVCKCRGQRAGEDRTGEGPTLPRGEQLYLPLCMNKGLFLKQGLKTTGLDYASLYTSSRPDCSFLPPNFVNPYSAFNIQLRCVCFLECLLS